MPPNDDRCDKNSLVPGRWLPESPGASISMNRNRKREYGRIAGIHP